MENRIWAVLLMLLLGGTLALSALPSRAGEGDTLGIPFVADVRIDATGKGTVGDILRRDRRKPVALEAKLAGWVRASLESPVYVAARIGDQAVASSSFVSGTVVLEPVDDENLEARLQGLKLGPVSGPLEPPRYPVDMARSGQAGSVLVVFRIDGDGHPRDIRYLDASDARVEAALKQVIPKWRFKPERVDGAVSDDPVAVPVWFHPMGSSSTMPNWACPAPVRRPYLTGQDPCLDVIEVAAMPMR